MSNIFADNPGVTVLAVGALGTAASHVVDGLKIVPWIDLAGFERLFSGREIAGRAWGAPVKANLNPLLEPLKLAYGDDAIELMQSQYRNGRGKGDLPRTLRQGVRIGLSMMAREAIQQAALGIKLDEQTASKAAEAMVLAATVRPPALGQPDAAITSPLDDLHRNALARLETAIDARIEAALALAEVQYVTQMKIVATFVAIGIALVAGWLLETVPLLHAFIVGLAAVPLAPVAKDLATGLQSAVKALKPRGPHV